MLKKKWLSFKRRWLPYLIAYSAKYAMRAVMRTCKIKIEGMENFKATAQTSPCILMLWHNRLAAIPEILHRFASQFNYNAFISKSRDGDPLALLTQSYKIGNVIRVAHNARHHALSTMISQLKTVNEIMIITPDGPRGPRYVLKPGIVVAAHEAKALIVPFSWKANRYWTLKTWDGMMIPKPFSTLQVTFGPAIALPTRETMDFEADSATLTAALKL